MLYEVGQEVCKNYEEKITLLLSCISFFISAFLWFKIATLDRYNSNYFREREKEDSKNLDTSKRDNNEEISKISYEDVPNFNKNNFYEFYIKVIPYIIRNYSKLDEWCRDKNFYYKISAILNPTAALFTAFGVLFQAALIFGKYSIYIDIILFLLFIALAYYQKKR